MKRTALTLLAALVAACTSVKDPLAGYAPNPIVCEGFATQERAQAFYKAHPEHWWTLDPDMNGMACDERKRVGE